MVQLLKFGSRETLLGMLLPNQAGIEVNDEGLQDITVIKISAGPQTLTGKIWVGLASFPSLSCINFGKIMLWSGNFQILFWRLT